MIQYKLKRRWYIKVIINQKLLSFYTDGDDGWLCVVEVEGNILSIK